MTCSTCRLWHIAGPFARCPEGLMRRGDLGRAPACAGHVEARDALNGEWRPASVDNNGPWSMPNATTRSGLESGD